MRDGFESFTEAINGVSAGAAGGRLRITATNAFAARWLVPRLPKWREAHPRLKLDIIGRDVARLWLLYRAPKQPPEAGIDQTLCFVGTDSCIRFGVLTSDVGAIETCRPTPKKSAHRVSHTI
jgi:hypothetical protein